MVLRSMSSKSVTDTMWSCKENRGVITNLKNISAEIL